MQLCRKKPESFMGSIGASNDDVVLVTRILCCFFQTRTLTLVSEMHIFECCCLCTDSCLEKASNAQPVWSPHVSTLQLAPAPAQGQATAVRKPPTRYHRHCRRGPSLSRRPSPQRRVEPLAGHFVAPDDVHRDGF